MTGGPEGLIEAVQEVQRIVREVDSVGLAYGYVTCRNEPPYGVDLGAGDGGLLRAPATIIAIDFHIIASSMCN